MKKIAIFAMLAMLQGGILMAQKAIPEKDVKVNYVKDFQRQVPKATAVQWWQMDSLTFRVTYRDTENSRMAMVFSNKGAETHYYIEDHYPHAITDTVARHYQGYNITDLWMRKVRGKMTYQTRIAKRSGFLWWKKESDPKILNFEIDGKFLGE
ncbi:MAG: hypothetical protein J6I49_01255 [Bacteroidales bacterium]|nr:hypothetical protein [Bacteroidales bacterium]